MADEPAKPGAFKENAGVATAMIVVGAFVGIGYVKILEGFVLAKPIDIPGDWMAAMLSLASAAIGYLFGRKSGSPSYGQDDIDRALATPPPSTSGRGPCPPLTHTSPAAPPSAVPVGDEFTPPPGAPPSAVPVGDEFTPPPGAPPRRRPPPP